VPEDDPTKVPGVVKPNETGENVPVTPEI